MSYLKESVDGRERRRRDQSADEEAAETTVLGNHDREQKRRGERQRRGVKQKRLAVCAGVRRVVVAPPEPNGSRSDGGGTRPITVDQRFHRRC